MESFEKHPETMVDESRLVLPANRTVSILKLEVTGHRVSNMQLLRGVEPALETGKLLADKVPELKDAAAARC